MASLLFLKYEIKLENSITLIDKLRKITISCECTLSLVFRIIWGKTFCIAETNSLWSTRDKQNCKKFTGQHFIWLLQLQHQFWITSKRQPRALRSIGAGHPAHVPLSTCDQEGKETALGPPEKTLPGKERVH